MITYGELISLLSLLVETGKLYIEALALIITMIAFVYKLTKKK